MSPDEDPCGKYMALYEACVKKHVNGLRTDEECQQEAEDYKLCRKQVRERATKK